MYKRFIDISTVVLGIVLICLSVLVGINFSKLSQDFNTRTAFDVNNPPDFRFMIILDGTDTSFVKEIELGVLSAARDYKIAYEIWNFKGNRKEEEILQQFDIAIESNVDGIIIQAFDDEGFRTLLSKSNYREVPVTTVGTDILGYEKVSFLAYNEYAIGARIGTLLNQHFESEKINNGTIVLLQNDNYTEQDQGLGMMEKLESDFTIKTEIVDYKGENTLNAEGVTRNIINLYDDLVAIVCSSGEETLGVVQALKDTDKINEVVVIGNDDYPEILDYIERGTVYATVVADNERLGYEAMVHMYEFNTGQFVSQYKDIRVNIIQKSNMDSYLTEVGDRYDKE